MTATEFEKMFEAIRTARECIAQPNCSNSLTAEYITTYLKNIRSLLDSLKDVSKDLPLIVKPGKALQAYVDVGTCSVQTIQDKLNAAFSTVNLEGSSTSSTEESHQASTDQLSQNDINALHLSQDRNDVIASNNARLHQLNTDNQSAYREELSRSLNVFMEAGAKNYFPKFSFLNPAKSPFFGALVIQCNSDQCVKLLLSVHDLDVFFEKKSSPTAYLRHLMLNIPRDQLGEFSAGLEPTGSPNQPGVYQKIVDAFREEIAKLNALDKETLVSYTKCLEAIQASARERDFSKITWNTKSISRDNALVQRNTFCENIKDLLEDDIKQALDRAPIPSGQPQISVKSSEIFSQGQEAQSSHLPSNWTSIPSSIMRVMLSNEVLTVVGLGVLYTVVDAIPSELPSIPSFRDIFATGSEINAIEEGYNYSDPLGVCMGVFD